MTIDDLITIFYGCCAVLSGCLTITIVVHGFKILGG